MDPYALGLAARRRLPDRDSHAQFCDRRSGAAWELQRRLPGIQVRPRMGPNYMLSQVTSPWASTALVEEPGDRGSASASDVRHPLRRRSSCLISTCQTRRRSGWPSCRACWTPTAAQSRNGTEPAVSSYTTTSPRLRDDVIFLVRSLGGRYTRIRPAIGRVPGLVEGRSRLSPPRRLVIDIRLPASLEPFRLTRKLESIARPRRRASDALYRQHRAGRHRRRPSASPSQQPTLSTTHRGLPAHPQHLNDSFIILDEAAEHLAEQMKMFLDPAWVRFPGGGDR